MLGDPSNGIFNLALNQFITEKILPQIIELNYRKFFLLFNPRQSWKDHVGENLTDVIYEQRFIYSYGLDPNNLSTTLEVNLPPGFQLLQITSELLNHSDIKNLNIIAADIKACWKSTDQYLHTGGMGYCLLKDNEIAAWCSTDYITGNVCELYIETFEDDQR